MTADTVSADIKSAGPRRLSLRVNFSWTFAGNLLYTIARWGMLMVLAKLGDAATVGVYAIGLAICQPVTFLTSLHLRPALVTDARHEYSYGQYIGLRLVGAALIVIITTAVVFVAGYDRETKLIVILIGTGAAIISVREMFLGVMQRHECMNLSGQSQIILSFAAFAAFATVYALTRSLVWTIVGLLVVRSGVLLLRDVPMARAVVRKFAKPDEPLSLRPDWALGMLGRLGVRVLPLGLAMTIGAFSNNVQHYFLKGYHGDAVLGYYAAMASIMTAATLLVNTLGIAASPRLAESFVSNRCRFRRLLVRLQGIAGGLGLAGVAATVLMGGFVLRILFTAEYAAYASEFVWLAVATTCMFMASMFVYALTAARAFVLLLCAWCVAAVISVVLASLLIPAYGIQGAAWSRVASTVTLLVMMAVATLIVMRRPVDGRAGDAASSSDVAAVDG